ncbi:MAG: ATP-binding cassette domain-containing protein [Phycisphaeraceae bacterium]|nr:ATP-binding cassette domain-containing protein [Phycisphaerae bacterium]MBX3393134.1 ATP-binding cassette domain-containing protein [Phycisphaeraceae bacterium]HRJ49473.1 ATP-binding cassette domain-containing protein [Phycisphaerales bacterium]
MEHAIELRGVHKTFGPKVAVKELDLVIPTGSLCGFIGPNGAGKTTTIRMIMSIIFPDRGELTVLGRSSAVESKDRIGYLPEERGVYRKMKVGQFLVYLGRLKGMPSAGLEGKVKDWLARVGLGDCFRKRCEELSKGMQQKVQFISAVLHEPDLIILDEPFSGLDPINRRLLRDLINEQHGAGRTVIFSTHAMFEAEQLCERVFMINRGEKVLDGTLAEIWEKYDPRCLFVETIGSTDDAMLASVSSIPGVREAAAEPRGIDVRLLHETDPGPVMSAIAGRVPARRVEIKRPNLEDIFIDLVGGSAEAIRAELADLHGGDTTAAIQEASA